MSSRHDPSDDVDAIVEAWRRERPDLDVSPLEVLSRVDRLSRHLDRARRAVVRFEPGEKAVMAVADGGGTRRSRSSRPRRASSEKPKGRDGPDKGEASANPAGASARQG